MLESFAAWLGRTPLSAFVADQAWVVPTVQTIHILAISVVMGAVAILHLRVLGVVERGQSVAALTHRFTGPFLCALLVLAVTGFLSIAAEPTRALFRYVFWAKMALLALAIVLTAVVVGGLRSRGLADSLGAPAPVPFRLLAILALAVWAGVIVTGRWIGYAQGWPGAPG